MQVTQSEFAKEINLTKGRVSQLVKAKVLTVCKNGKLDLETATQEYIASLGEGKAAIPTGAGTDQLKELVNIKLELAKAKLEQQKAATDLARLKGEIQKGAYVSNRAACLLHSRIVWKLYHQIEMEPLKFLHHLGIDRLQIVEIDSIFRDDVKRTFQTTISDSVLGRENAYILEKADAIIQLCESGIILTKHKGCDTEDLEACLEFVREIRKLFFDMNPGLVEKLGISIGPKEPAVHGHNSEQETKK